MNPASTTAHCQQLPAITLAKLAQIPTEGGAVMHAMKHSDPGFQGFGEAYFSTVYSGAIKAWKRHKKMTLNLVVPYGTVKIVCYDDRLSNKINLQTFMLSPENYQRLTVPANIWFGFQGMAAATSILLNIADRSHDSNEVERMAVSAIDYAW